MPALYRLACALVFASVNEGFGLAVLEAMACGTPVVVSRIAPFTEYLGADALVAGYVSMREPGQLFQEFTALMAQREPSFQNGLDRIEEKLGAGFAANFTAAAGTEAAFALQPP